MNKLFKRCDKLAFYGVKDESGQITYRRMTGFTEIQASKQPKEYKRQYVDEEFETTDVVGYSPAISYSFDRFSGNPVHEDIVKITDDELLGSDAVRTIIMVDLEQNGEGKYNAISRNFSVIPDSEGGKSEAYTYQGSFKANGDKERITVITNDNWESITISQ